MEFSDPRLDALERMVKESERSMRELMEAMRELQNIEGQGESRSGAVSAQVNAEGRLADVRIGARAMRLGSDELAKEVLEAVRAAQDDHERQAREITNHASTFDDKLLGAFKPDEGLLGAFKRDLEEIQESYARESGERLENMRRRQREQGH